MLGWDIGGGKCRLMVGMGLIVYVYWLYFMVNGCYFVDGGISEVINTNLLDLFMKRSSLVVFKDRLIFIELVGILLDF